MKRCKIIGLIIAGIIVTICIAMIVRINILFPQAEDVSFTVDNPANIDGIIVKPVGYQVCTIQEYSKLSSKYANIREDKIDRSRVVLFTISIENTTEEVADYVPSYIFVSEELNAFNGVTPIDSGTRHCTLLPHETKEIKLQAYIGPAQLDDKKLDKLDSSTITLVYSFYPYRKKLVFSR